MDAPQSIAFVAVLAIMITVAFVIALHQYAFPKQTWVGEEWHLDREALKAATTSEPPTPVALLKGPQK